MADNGDMESDDCQILKSLWESVLLAIEYGKANPRGMTKYQRNFCLMIEDVMNHHAYLFTDKEKSFLGTIFFFFCCLCPSSFFIIIIEIAYVFLAGAFNSLSDNGQWLFIRLYTRKGGFSLAVDLQTC